MHNAAEYREHDLADLMLRWWDAMDFCRLVQTEESAAKEMESFNAILEYLHAGEIPEVPKSQERQVLVRHSFMTKPDEGSA